MTFLKSQSKNADVIKLKAALLKAVDSRMGWMFTKNNVYLKSAALDPHYGSLEMISDKLRDEVWDSLVEEWKIQTPICC